MFGATTRLNPELSETQRPEISRYFPAVIIQEHQEVTEEKVMI
jgi:hypothetical protein